MLPYNDFAANGNNPLNSVSQPKGALQLPLPRHPIPKNKTWPFTQKSGHTRGNALLQEKLVQDDEVIAFNSGLDRTDKSVAHF